MVDALSPSLPAAENQPAARSSELETLSEWLGADRGSVAMVHGRRGVGKVRLAEDLIKHAAAQPNGAGRILFLPL